MTNMKKGLKKSAPDTPELIAMVENSTDAGNTHHNCRNSLTRWGLVLVSA